MNEAEKRQAQKERGDRLVDWYNQAIDAIDYLLSQIDAGKLFAPEKQIYFLRAMKVWHRRKIESIIGEFALDRILPGDLEGSVWDSELDLDLAWMDE